MLGFGISLAEVESICGQPLVRRLYILRTSPLPGTILASGIQHTRVADLLSATLGGEATRRGNPERIVQSVPANSE